MIKHKRILKTLALVCGLFAAQFAGDIFFNFHWMNTPAEARLGRPLTPGSVAGVARRTTRRRVRRTAMYVATLPSGCHTTVVINGATLYQCGGTYYQVHGTQYVVVTVD